MSKKKLIILLVIIFCFIVILIGGTYAWLTFNQTVVDSNKNTVSACFIIDSDYTNDDTNIDKTTALSGTLFQSSKPRAGLSGTVGMKINYECDVDAVGDIFLTVNENTDSVLYKKTPAHCENPTTLETLVNYTDSYTCTTYGGTWVEENTKSALKYAVYENIAKAPLVVGHINDVGTMTLYDDFVLNYLNKVYYIYIWLDGNLADNEYFNVSFDGYIHLGATQTETYAVYSEDDYSLRFYRSKTLISVGDTYNGRSVTNVYKGFEDSSRIPWDSIKSLVRIVSFDGYVYPVTTANWFSNMNNVEFMELKNLDISKVTNMNGMFQNSSIVNPIDLSVWNVCNVTNYSNFSSSTNMTQPFFGDSTQCNGGEPAPQ